MGADPRLVAFVLLAYRQMIYDREVCASRSMTITPRRWGSKMTNVVHCASWIVTSAAMAGDWRWYKGEKAASGWMIIVGRK